MTEFDAEGFPLSCPRWLRSAIRTARGPLPKLPFTRIARHPAWSLRSAPDAPPAAIAAE